MKTLFSALLRVEVKGAEVLRSPAIIVANHLSSLDEDVLKRALPPFIRAPHDLDDVLPFVQALQKGVSVLIFPEGRASDTGALMKFYDGVATLARKSDVPVSVLHIDGTQHTVFTKLRGKMPFKLWPRVTITVMPAAPFTTLSDLRARMETAQLKARHTARSFWDALSHAAKTHGAGRIVAEDVQRQTLSYRTLMMRARVLGLKLQAVTQSGENVGLMLPTVNATLVAFFALQAWGRVPAMLNPGAGLANLNAAIQVAGIKTVITSRRLVSVAGLEDVVVRLDARVLYLEDIAATLTLKDKVAGLRTKLPAQPSPFAPGVILFTSGSENTPKAVVLSHDNILVNIAQMEARVDFNYDDVAFNALPLFHTFGLMAGALLPLMTGIRTFLYPNPLHYKQIPECVYQSRATMMFASDTLLNGYAQQADPYDFRSVRKIFAGAERLREETRRLYADKFGVRVHQGYGVTETSPVIAVNTAMSEKTGTVGRIVPGLEARLEPVEGLDVGGRLFVRGPNVMMGYYNPGAPGVIVPPKDGWHDTGDIVTIDDDQFITIAGRAKRFAKIAGEMVSLATSESLASALYPEGQHAAVSRPDDKRGEQVVLYTTAAGLKRDELIAQAKLVKAPDLAVPKRIVIVQEMPLLPSGKIDHAMLTKMAVSD